MENLPESEKIIINAINSGPLYQGVPSRSYRDIIQETEYDSSILSQMLSSLLIKGHIGIGNYPNNKNRYFVNVKTKPTKADEKLDTFKKSLVVDLRSIIFNEDTDYVTLTQTALKYNGINYVGDVQCNGCKWEEHESVRLYQIPDSSSGSIDVMSLPCEKIVELINLVSFLISDFSIQPD